MNTRKNMSINNSFEFIVFNSKIKGKALPLSNFHQKMLYREIDKDNIFPRIEKPDYVFLIEKIFNQFSNLNKKLYGITIREFLDQEGERLSKDYKSVTNVWSAILFNHAVLESKNDALNILSEYADETFDLNPIIDDVNNFYRNLVFDTTSLKNKTSTYKLDIEEVRLEIKEFWKDRDRSLDEDIPHFIARVYKKFIGKGLTRAHLKVDKTLYSEQAKWVSKNGGEFPKWLNVPKAQKNHPDNPPTAEEFAGWRRVQAYRAATGSASACSE